MASHQLAIAKASFTASLLRPDPTSVSRDEITYFHNLMNLVASHCSATNVQNCKRWVLRNAIQSTARFAAFGKYLTALCTSFEDTTRSSTLDTSQRKPSAKRKRLNLLYLINDVLHHTLFHAKDASVTGKMQPFLIGLFSNTASFANSPKHHRKIEGLLDIWEDKSYFSMEYIDKLRETVKIGRDTEQSSGSIQPLNQFGKTQSDLKPYKNTPFIMPAIHGDQGTPWYDLPAGNLMPHIIPNSTRPINPALVRPLRFVTGPADEDLASAVKNLLQEVNHIYGVAQFQDQRGNESSSSDIDELGQDNFHDEASGGASTNDSYYGWSKQFCEKTKRLLKGLENSQMVGNNERRSRSESQTSSLSRYRYKKRRFSDSDGESTRGRTRSCSRSRVDQRSYSSSRSRSRETNIPQQRDKYSNVSPECTSRSTSSGRNSGDITSHASASQLPALGAFPNLVREQHGQDMPSIPALQQSFLPPSGHNFPSAAMLDASSLPPHHSQWPSQMQLPPSTLSCEPQIHPAELWPQPPPPHLIPNWPVAPYGRLPTGPHHLGRSSEGAFVGRERGGAAPQQHQGSGPGYNRYGDDSRGNRG